MPKRYVSKYRYRFKYMTRINIKYKYLNSLYSDVFLEQERFSMYKKCPLIFFKIQSIPTTLEEFVIFCGSEIAI